MKTIQLPCQIIGFSTRVDGGYGIRLVTQELIAQEALLLHQYRGAIGYFLFKENEFNDNEVPKEDANFEGKKPSQRLRNTIFVYWQKNKQDAYPDFDKYYRSQMEGIINQFKDKLE